jgi:hypothetical protein
VSFELCDILSRPSVWIYEGRNNGWWYYDLPMQDLLEESWNAKELTVDTTELIVDMKTMSQTTLSGAVRAIRRISPVYDISGLLIKGVAGRRI